MKLATEICFEKAATRVGISLVSTRGLNPRDRETAYYNVLRRRPTSQRETPPSPPPATGEREREQSSVHGFAAAAAAGHVGGDGAELNGVVGGVRARLRGHRPHPPPPGVVVVVVILLLVGARPQARLHLRRQPRPPRLHCHRVSPFPQGAGGGVAAGACVPEERARGVGVSGGGGVVQQGQVREGSRRRRAVPAQGGPRGVPGLRPAPRGPPGQVLLPLHHPQARERGDEARRRGERQRVRADVRGQGRRLDARRRRPLENVCGDLPTSSSHEKL